MAVLRLSMAKLDGSGSSITTVASGHSSLNRMVEKPALAPAGQHWRQRAAIEQQRVVIEATAPAWTEWWRS